MYCNRKDELRAKTVKHTEKMKREYLGEITQAHRASAIYDDKNVPPAKRDGDPEYALLKKGRAYLLCFRRKAAIAY